MTAEARPADPYAGQYDVNKTPDPRYAAHNYNPGEIIVKFKEQSASGSSLQNVRGQLRAPASARALNALLEKYSAGEAEKLMPVSGAQVTPQQHRKPSLYGKEIADENLSNLYLLRLDPSKAENLQEVAKEFSALAEVDYAEPNYLVYACSTGAAEYVKDPMYSQQWGIKAINLDKLWEVPAITDKRPVIAILDTGVDIEHPDLEANIWTNSMEENGSDSRDDDANGFIDDIHGWDFVNNTARMRDNNGHGTHCAGIAAATGGNGIGITGANPDALIMPVTVLQSNGTGDIATIIRGLDYAAANGADVISMSFGSYSTSIALHDALAKAYQKAVLVAAAGNDGKCIYPWHLAGAPMFPAAYSFVLGVEASDNSGARASFSNFDCDGPITSTFAELYNYELRAPGTNIISTFPGGQYKALNGTSMATPLVAGAISRLMTCRNISSKEELFGDLIATSKGNIDIYSAYSLTDAQRRPTLSLVTYRLDDEKMGDGDGHPDAGETIRIYPTFRNAWGNARNITYSIKLHELEDPAIIEFIDNGAAHVISNLSSYASVVTESPFLVKISPDCADGRIIRFVVEASCDNISKPLSQEIEFTVENGIELGGILRKDITLTPENNYIVTSVLVVPQNITLTILPGTRIKFKRNTGISVDKGDEYVNGVNGYPNSGKVLAIGTPEKKILFAKVEGEGEDNKYSSGWHLGNSSEFEYCEFYDLKTTLNGSLSKLLVHNSEPTILRDASVSQSTFFGNYMNYGGEFNHNLDNVNIVRNFSIRNDFKTYGSYQIHNFEFCYTEEMRSTNSFNNMFCYDGRNYYFSAMQKSSNGGIGKLITTNNPSYFGSDKESTLQRTIWDIKNPYYTAIGLNMLSEFDLSNRLIRPAYLAPGIVWKVVVNDYDAQDEYEYLPPLGVGKHKFEVYFSKPMNHAKTPTIAMGVREPYTQIAIAEDGSWRSETMENGDVIDIYTAYLTINGRDNYDGVNTIYVADAEDEEFFPIPIEDVRFHVNVQSAGAMSSGFTAEAGVGRVTLTWDNPEENFDDMLGYNMYRYTLGANDAVGDTIKINETLLTDETLIDYDIVPGTTYCYYYKVLRTSLDENAPSKTVAATPRAAGKGDANASGDVSVADVVSEVSYIMGEDPKPFMFEAADVNSDNSVDVLDVVGTVNIIMNPAGSASVASLADNYAVYSIENGVLYIESNVELSGVQIDFEGDRSGTEITTLDPIRGMEATRSWIADNACRVVAFSFSGRSIATGKQALLEIGSADVKNIILVDAFGRSVPVTQVGTTGIEEVKVAKVNIPYPNPFKETLNIPLSITADGNHEVEISLSNLAGMTCVAATYTLGYGDHTLSLNTGNIAEGFYIVTIAVDGKKVESVKAIKK